MRVARFTEPSKVKVFPDAMTANLWNGSVLQKPAVAAMVCIVTPGSLVTWDSRPWKILNVGQATVSLLGENQVVSATPFAVFEELVKAGRILGVQPSETSAPNREALERIAGAGEAELRRANDLQMGVPVPGADHHRRRGDTHSGPHPAAISSPILGGFWCKWNKRSATIKHGKRQSEAQPTVCGSMVRRRTHSSLPPLVLSLQAQL